MTRPRCGPRSVRRRVRPALPNRALKAIGRSLACSPDQRDDARASVPLAEKDPVSKVTAGRVLPATMRSGATQVFEFAGRVTVGRASAPAHRQIRVHTPGMGTQGEIDRARANAFHQKAANAAQHVDRRLCRIHKDAADPPSDSICA